MLNVYHVEPGTTISATEFLDILEGDFDEVVVVKCIIEGDLHISESRIERDEEGKYQIHPRIFCLGSTFNGVLDFNSTRFTETVRFGDTQFVGPTDFNDVQFRYLTSFCYTQFRSQADFSHTQFSAPAFFRRAQFRGQADFSHAQFSRRTVFSSAYFRSQASFNHAQFDWTGFTCTQFESRPDFSHAQFRNGVIFLKTQFNRGADFCAAEFSDKPFFGLAKFGTVTVELPLRLKKRYRINPTPPPYTPRSEHDFYFGILGFKHSKIRQFAAETLGQLGNPMSVLELKEQLSRESVEAVRISLMKAIEKLEG